MKQRIINKILKHAELKGEITIASTAKFARIAPQTAKEYLINMSLKDLLKMEEITKEDEKRPTGYTYRYWRLKKC